MIRLFFCWNYLHNKDTFFVDLKKRQLVNFFNYAITEMGWSSNRISTIKSSLSSMSDYIENVLDDENEYNAAQRNLLFDDETLSVSYQLHNETIFSRVCDTLPVFIIIASCAFIIVFIVSVAIYFKKKKSLN